MNSDLIKNKRLRRQNGLVLRLSLSSWVHLSRTLITIAHVYLLLRIPSLRGHCKLHNHQACAQAQKPQCVAVAVVSTQRPRSLLLWLCLSVLPLHTSHSSFPASPGVSLGILSTQLHSSHCWATSCSSLVALIFPYRKQTEYCGLNCVPLKVIC